MHLLLRNCGKSNLPFWDLLLQAAASLYLMGGPARTKAGFRTKPDFGEDETSLSGKASAADGEGPWFKTFPPRILLTSLLYQYLSLASNTRQQLCATSLKRKLSSTTNSPSQAVICVALRLAHLTRESHLALSPGIASSCRRAMFH